MTAKTDAERKAAERQRRALAGLKEVRGIWASEEHEKAIKRFAERLREKEPSRTRQP